MHVARATPRAMSCHPIIVDLRFVFSGFFL